MSSVSSDDGGGDCTAARNVYFSLSYRVAPPPDLLQPSEEPFGDISAFVKLEADLPWTASVSLRRNNRYDLPFFELSNKW